MDTPSTSTDVGPGKRQLPSRNRRSTTVAVGGGELDLTILEATRVKDGEAILKNRQRIWASTEARIGQDCQELGPHKLTNVQTDRYFSHENSMRSYREQVVIQTPEFSNLLDHPIASTRTRLRTNDQPPPFDTREPAYERRHKKYDAFEKRLKIREKEKLQHDHYKLKERIEQLRGIDSSAFLSLPADCFPDEDQDYDGQPSSSVNGGSAPNEGERRRGEMLKAAMSLHERYRQLLPAERVPKKGPKAPEQVHYVEPEPLPESGPVKARNVKPPAPTRSPSTAPSAAPSISNKKPKPPGDAIYIKRKQHQQRHPSPPPAAIYTNNVGGLNEEEGKMHIERISDIRTNIHSSPATLQSATFTRGPKHDSLSAHIAQQSPPVASPLHPHSSHTIRVIKDASSSDLSHQSIHEAESISTTRPKKRSRISKTPAPAKHASRAISVPNVETYSGTPPPPAADSPATSSVAPGPSGTTKPPRQRAKPGPKKENSLLILAASHVTRDKGTRRGRDAFGAKIPRILSEEYEYELPADILLESERALAKEPPPDDEQLSMTGRQPDGEGDSEDECDELDDDSKLAMQAQRLAMIDGHHAPRSTHSKGTSGDWKVMDMEADDQTSFQYAGSRDTLEAPKDEDRMQE